MIQLTLPYPPTLNNLYATVHGRRVLSRDGRRYKLVVAHAAAQAGVEMLSGEIAITLDVFRPKRQGDLDNIQKVLLDSLTRVAWIDDRQVVDIHARRFDDKANPRVEVTIEEVAR